MHILLGKQVFIHELQCEPWGPKSIWSMTVEEQDESMDAERLAKNIAWARNIKAHPIDLWGAEWWYWRDQDGDATINYAVKDNL